MKRSMMSARGVPKQFWAEAVATAVYILNISPTNTVYNRTPYEAWRGTKREESHLRNFGCVAYALVNSSSQKILDDKSQKYVFVGYSTQSKGYKLYDPVNGKSLISRDVVSNEEESWNFTSMETNSSSKIPYTSQDDVFDAPVVHSVVHSSPESSPPGSIPSSSTANNNVNGSGSS
ncbi:retrovirus-related pol polyprotein from transposon TNT 1-94, partial [Tanacetum coccineum]